ncbi:MAG: T9SS type B sorting domain-containing protein [Maribacter sp.]
MMRITSILVLIGLLLPTLFFGQGETSNWYFGNGAGITFNNDGSVTPVNNGKLDTFEGCATISNSFGDLLFYTDGIRVYNQDHKLMNNGAGLFGDPSSTQSAIIVPKPEDPNIFFIFTVDTSAFQDDPDRGLNYSVVDMSLDGGKGDILQKNIPLLPDCSEKIAAVVKDCSDQSIWLLTFAAANGQNYIFDTFHAFEINVSGVVEQAVKTTFSSLKIEDPRGYIKLSPDGTKLANANMQGGLYLYDFDAATGKLSNQEEISISGLAKAAYGVEFSSNSQYLYIHASNDVFNESSHRSSLIQYDLLAPDISASQETIDARNGYRGALQIGDNGKIYRTTADNYFNGTPFLSVIHNPDQKGEAANYQHNAVDLNGKNATQGLPPFIQSLFNKIALVKNEDGTKSSSTAICEGEAVILEAEIIPGANYVWEKDGVVLPITGNTIDLSNSSENDSGKYRLTINTGDPKDCPIIGEASVQVVPLPETNFIVLEQCDVDEDISDGVTTLDLEQASNGKDLNFTFYETIADQNNGTPILNPESYTNTNPNSQTIFYEVANILGCTATGEIELIINPAVVNASIASPFVNCDENAEDTVLEASFDLDVLRQSYSGVDVAFYLNLGDVSLERNPQENILKSSNSTIYVRIENENQCVAVETVELVVHPLPEINLNDTYEVCSDGESLVIDAPAGFDTYTWYKTESTTLEIASNSAQITITEGGSFRLEVGVTYDSSNQSITCRSTKDFVVIASNRATFEEITIEDLTTNNSISAIVSGDGEYEFSLDGVNYQNTPLFENIEPGFYTVFARDRKGCGISEEEIVVVGFPKFFTPNGDGLNDTWQLIGSGKNLIEGDIAIYDRYGKLLKQIDADSQGWDGTIVGGTLPDSDYWFRITLINGRELKGHFSLKR